MRTRPFNPRVWNRRLHRWIAIAVALPFLVILTTGVMLQLKKQLAWVQPPTTRTHSTVPTIGFDAMLAATRTVPAARVSSWQDIDRLDVRPADGIVKVQTRSRWEVQLDLVSGEIVQVAYRRSDLIESLHDGSWFHPRVKLWVFLPAGIALAGLWVTGMYLIALPYLARRRRAGPPPSGAVITP